MECPWEKAIRLVSNRQNYAPTQVVEYLLQLEEDLQLCVNAAPNTPIPFLPRDPPAPRPQRGTPAPNEGQRRNGNNNQNGQNNRFQMHQEEDEEVDVGGAALQPNQPGRGRRQRAPNGGSSDHSADDIYIQIITTLGEMLGLIALEQGKESLWAEGAKSFADSFRLLNVALSMSDAMYASITARQEIGDMELAHVVERVRNKCHGISIAATHSHEQKEHFLHVALRRREKLQHNLEPQWQDRDLAKAKMGEEAWTNNPRPKKNYAMLRAKDEQELKALETAMEALQAMDYETVREQADQRMRTL